MSACSILIRRIFLSKYIYIYICLVTIGVIGNSLTRLTKRKNVGDALIFLVLVPCGHDKGLFNSRQLSIRKCNGVIITVFFARKISLEIQSLTERIYIGRIGKVNSSRPVVFLLLEFISRELLVNP